MAGFFGCEASPPVDVALDWAPRIEADGKAKRASISGRARASARRRGSAHMARPQSGQRTTSSTTGALAVPLDNAPALQAAVRVLPLA